ncbi:actin interacting protein 3-domain-containing protein [Lipomyces japonicus]|uniref:actin interacting protein 3-domain-containing protein n=1 Tax=Lipomyces japonicus TaxID=56871 RepID=UPI0034CDD31B
MTSQVPYENSRGPSGISIGNLPSNNNGGRNLNRSSAKPTPGGGSQRNNAYKRQASINTIESSVTKLLVATKQLLECLTQWSRGDTTEKEVSDVYVSLGNEFNITSRAFQRIGIDVSDLGDVPAELRVILEEALSNEQNVTSLDTYLPAIREIIVNLLQGLKAKQARLRSVGNPSGAASSVSQSSNPVLFTTNKERSPVRRGNTITGSSSPTRHDHSVPSRSSSVNTSPTRRGYALVETYTVRNPSPPRHTSRIDFTSSTQGRDDILYRNSSLSRPEIASISESQTEKLANNAVPNINQQLHPPNDPLAALQRGDALERRASRRFSAYQYAKLGVAGASAEVHNRARSDKIDNTDNGANVIFDKDHRDGDAIQQSLSAESNRVPLFKSPKLTKKISMLPSPKIDQPESLVVYLRIGRQTKKAIIDIEDVSIKAIRMLFVERFSYSPRSDDFPDLYVQDSENSVRYELEESTIGDIKEGVIVSLNVESVNEERKQLEERLDTLLSQFNEFKTTLMSQVESMANYVEQNQAPAAQIESLSKAVEKVISGISAPAPAVLKNNSSSKSEPKVDKSIHLEDLASLRKELAALRQVHSSLAQSVDKSLTSIKEKVATTDSSMQTSIVTTGHAQIGKYHDKLSNDCDDLLTRVDDLQDIVEAIRKDVANRGVRPDPRHLEHVTKDLEFARSSLGLMEEYIRIEKPTWKKILERELDNVVEEQQFFKLQEDLVGDLRDDLEQATETLSLVKLFAEEQSKNPRSRVPTPALTTADALSSKDAVLAEVRALSPNHDSRVEAIEKAERLRKVAQESQVDEFEKELGEFVEEGKLKKSGGIDEVERIRKLREEKMWKEFNENQAALATERMNRPGPRV